MSAQATALRPSSTLHSSELRLAVKAKREVADGVVTLELVHPDGLRLPDWSPGSHIDLFLPGGETRQYSLCGDRTDTLTYRIGILREPDGRGGSAYVHDDLQVGDVLTVGGPRNNFHLVPAPHYLFIAGGIGITPILAMIDQARRLGVPYTLLYGGRTAGSMAFTDELTDEPADGGGEVMLRPQDQHGHLDLATAIAGRPEGSRIYACGPAPLLDALDAACADLPAGTLRTERFVARDVGAPARTEPFTVRLERSGREITVPTGSSVLDAVTSAGVAVLSSCRQGVCGTCETGVLAGRVDHRDTLLDDDERQAGDCMFICVSRSVDDLLVLDL